MMPDIFDDFPIRDESTTARALSAIRSGTMAPTAPEPPGVAATPAVNQMLIACGPNTRRQIQRVYELLRMAGKNQPKVLGIASMLAMERKHVMFALEQLQHARLIERQSGKYLVTSAEFTLKHWTAPDA